MKNIFIGVFAAFAFTNIVAQDQKIGDQTSKGKWLIEVNTGNNRIKSTGIYFSSNDEYTTCNFGLDGGYFIDDNLAIKVGFGYGAIKFKNSDTDYWLSYRFGAKYYVMGYIPITMDITGSLEREAKIDKTETPLWFGVGAGYAWFLSEHISIEPGLRYNISLNNDYINKGIFQLNIGFVAHF